MSETKAESRLAVIWSAADRGVAQNMVFMYTKNSKLRDWWDRVRLVVWGPSSEMLAADAELQEELEDLKAAGVELQACRACADNYGVSQKLEELGIEVIYMGVPLTEMLKTGWHVLTF